MEKFDYEIIIKILNKLSKSVSRKHRELIVSDALLMVYENEGEFKEGRKVKPFVRKLFFKAKDNYFKELRKSDICVGGLEDLERIESEESGYII